MPSNFTLEVKKGIAQRVKSRVAEIDFLQLAGMFYMDYYTSFVMLFVTH